MHPILRRRSDLLSFLPERCHCKAMAADSSTAAEEVQQIDFDHLKFGLTETDAMFVATFNVDGGDVEWQGGVVPYGNLSVHPSASVLNYGQGCFEGMKAFTTAKNRIVTFRPYENAKRMSRGAMELSMPPVPEDFFVNAVKEVVAANRRFVPPEGKGALYIRPLLIGMFMK